MKISGEFTTDVKELTASYKRQDVTRDGIPTDRPESPNAGDLWFDLKTASVLVWSNGEWVDFLPKLSIMK